MIVAKRDRLGRDLIGVAMIERSVMRKGARIVSAAGEGTEGTDAGAPMQRQILDVFAEYERRLIGQRTKAALRAKREHISRSIEARRPVQRAPQNAQQQREWRK